ncbi:MAG TPA: TonB C-terminal domain-containing protein [Herbaspirillum sp.]
MGPTILERCRERHSGAPALALPLTFAVMLAVALGGCSSAEPDHAALVKNVLDNKAATTQQGGSTAGSIDEYKRELGRRIQQVNSTKVYVVRPQALLRSVIVVRFVVDADGGLVRSEIMRTNHDRQTEATAIASLRNTAPFPKPPRALLRAGKLEMSESWLFNNDGKFQVRSIALQQLDR